jgi:hypothetical protein
MAISKGLEMSLSLIVVSDDTLDGVPAKAQTLLVPTDTDVQIYHRVSNGQKGRGQAWQKLADTTSLPNSPITHEPCAVVVTDRDREMVSLGQVTNIGIKALYALDTATETTNGEPHRGVVNSLMKALYEGDESLNSYLQDQRRKEGVSLNPIVSVAEEVISAPTVVNIPVSNKTMSEVNQMVTIPDAKWANTYIQRKIINNLTEFDILDGALADKKNVLIEGHAGSGKTMSVLAYASARKMRYFNVACHIGLEASHLVGRWIPTEDGHFRWQDGAVTEIVRNGGVLLFNEFNFAPERFTTFIFSLLDDRREIQLMENGGEVIKAHPDLLIVADMNPDYRGTRPLNQALADRFAERLVYPYDKAIEMKLLKSKSLIEMAGQLRDEYNKGTLLTPISTRSLVALVDNANRHGLEYATYSYVNSFEGDEERSSVRLVVNTHLANIANDLGLEAPNSAIKQTEKVEVIDDQTIYSVPNMPTTVNALTGNMNAPTGIPTVSVTPNGNLNTEDINKAIADLMAQLQGNTNA